MRRREFIAVIGSAAVAWPIAARAEQSGKLPRVGILSPASNEAAATLVAFRKAICDLGYVEGETIILDFRLSKGNFDALIELAMQLVRVPVDVIVTDSTAATQAAASTKGTDITSGSGNLAQQATFLSQRNEQHGPDPGEFKGGTDDWIVDLGAVGVGR
jgi:ABC-type uncharacterized transport system substrate-binding protein